MKEIWKAVKGWMVFNREYKPLGFNKDDVFYCNEDYPIFTKYKITDKFIEKIADSKQQKNDEVIFWLYNDGNKPIKNGIQNKKNWEQYIIKIKLLSKLKRISYE